MKAAMLIENIETRRKILVSITHLLAESCGIQDAISTKVDPSILRWISEIIDEQRPDTLPSSPDAYLKVEETSDNLKTALMNAKFTLHSHEDSSECIDKAEILIKSKLELKEAMNMWKMSQMTE